MLEKITQLKEWTLEQVLWAEKNLRGKSGADKKAAVIKKLDDLIVLPFYLEWMDDIVISWLVDTVCEKLNFITNHDFKDLELTKEQEQDFAEKLETPEKLLEAIKGDEQHD